MKRVIQTVRGLGGSLSAVKMLKKLSRDFDEATLSGDSKTCLKSAFMSCIVLACLTIPTAVGVCMILSAVKDFVEVVLIVIILVLLFILSSKDGAEPQTCSPTAWQNLAVLVVSPVTGISPEIFAESGFYFGENGYHFQLLHPLQSEEEILLMKRKVEHRIVRVFNINLKSVRQNHIVTVSSMSICIRPM